MTTGQKLRKRREEAGLTMDMLAEAAGVGKRTIYNYEHDKTDPRLLPLTCITDVLGVSLDWLVGNEDCKRAAIKAEAFKEFAKASKEKSYKIRLATGTSRTVIDVFEIDNLLKEKAGADNGL